MPIYVYQVILPDGEEGQVFEVTQAMSDPPLTEHPVTGQPVERIIQAPHIGGRWSGSRSKNLTSDKNLERHGFTKYVKTDQGQYEKVVGDGPKQLNHDGLN